MKTQNERVIRVPKGWTIDYCDMDAQTQQVRLTANKEYIIETNNGRERSPIITISDVTPAGKEGKLIIVPNLMITPGFMNSVQPYKGKAIKVAEITKIEEVQTGYKSDRRTKKTMIGFSGKPDTFVFDKPDGKGEYRISIYTGELLAFSIKDDRPNSKTNRRSIYGIYKGFDQKTNEVIIDRLLASNGVRQLRNNVRIALDSLYGMYRYTLIVKEPEKPEAPEDPSGREPGDHGTTEPDQGEDSGTNNDGSADSGSGEDPETNQTEPDGEGAEPEA